DLTSGATKSLYLIATGNTFEQVAQRSDSLLVMVKQAQDRGKVTDYQGFNILPLSERTQKHKIRAWESFWTDQKKDVVKESLVQEEQRFGFANGAHSGFFRLLDADFQSLSFSDYQTLSLPGLSDYIAERDSFYTIATLVKLPLENKDAFIKQI